MKEMNNLNPSVKLSEIDSFLLYSAMRFSNFIQTKKRTNFNWLLFRVQIEVHFAMMSNKLHEKQYKYISHSCETVV